MTDWENLPYENVLNAYLAELLNDLFGGRGRCEPERKARRRRFDIRVIYDDMEFLIEASYDKNDADRDAKKRLEDGLIDTIVIALYYNPDYFRGLTTDRDIKKVFLEKPLELKIYVQGLDISKPLLRYATKKGIAREKTREWISFYIKDFEELIKAIKEFLIEKDIILDLSKEIEDHTKSFISRFKDSLKTNKIATRTLRTLYAVLFSPYGLENDEKKEMEGDLDVPIEIILAHTYISLLMACVLYDSLAPKHGLSSLMNLLTVKKHPLLTIHSAFKSILEIDYEPIFAVALDVLNELFNLQSIGLIMSEIKKLIKLSTKIVGNKVLLRQDFIGRIYHKVTGDIAVRKGYATFYTKHPIAYFLAYLTMHTPNPSWNINWCNINSLESFRICDFACGSGTLLSAIYEALLSLYRNHCYDLGQDPNLNDFHRIFLENIIWGFDALEYAVQTAAIVLSLRNPSVALEKMNLYHVPLEVSKGTPKRCSLGSLDFWSSKDVRRYKRKSLTEGKIVEVEIPKFDIIIMNPPFARTTPPGKEKTKPRIFGFVSDKEDFDVYWETYKDLIADMKKHIIQTEAPKHTDRFIGDNKLFSMRDIDPLKAGAAFPFIVMANKYLNHNGRLALVLPKTIIESSSTFLLRAMLLENYHIEYIVFSSEKKNLNFSFSTNISEILLIARKIGKNKQCDLPTYIINLRKQPKNTLEGILLAKKVLQSTQSMSSPYIKVKALSSEAEIRRIDVDDLENFVWNFSVITDAPPDLFDYVSKLLKGNILGVEIPLIKILDFNTARDSEIKIEVTSPATFRGPTLKKMISDEKGPYRILKKTGKNIINKLQLNINFTEPIRATDTKIAKRIRKNRARLLVPEAIRFNTAALIAVWSPEPIISNRAQMIKINPFELDDDMGKRIEKALCVWLNSSFIIAFLRLAFTTEEGNFGHIYKWLVNTIPIPDLTNEYVVEYLNRVFEKYKDKTWGPLKKQFENAIKNRSSVRLDYDLDIIEALSNAYKKPVDRAKWKNELIDFYSLILTIL